MVPTCKNNSKSLGLWTDDDIENDEKFQKSKEKDYDHVIIMFKTAQG